MKGGKREGAGRKPLSPSGRKQPINVKISPAALKFLTEHSDRTGIPKGQLVEQGLMLLQNQS